MGVNNQQRQRQTLLAAAASSPEARNLLKNAAKFRALGDDVNAKALVTTALRMFQASRITRVTGR